MLRFFGVEIMLKSPLDYANKNEIIVHHETVSFPVRDAKGTYVEVDKYIHNAWRAVLDVAVSYGLAGDPKYTLWIFPNAAASFKEQFNSAFNGNTDAAERAFQFYKDATNVPESTSGSRRKYHTSSSHVHVILKSTLFLTRVMRKSESGDDFYPYVILDEFDNPKPVIEENGKFYQVDTQPNGRVYKTLLKDSAGVMRTFAAFTTVFTQLLQRNRVQETGSWNGRPSRLYVLGEMMKVRAVQYNTSVEMASNYKKELTRATGSADGHKELLARMRQEEARLNQENREQLGQIEQQNEEIEGLKQNILELQAQIRELRVANSQQQEQTKSQLIQKERAYDGALIKKEAEYADSLRQKEEANQLLIKEIRENRAKIAQLESDIHNLEHSPTKTSSVNINTQFASLQKTNGQLTQLLAAQDDVLAEQTKSISELTQRARKLETDNQKLAAQNEKLEAENSVLLKALHSFFEFITSWFRAAPDSLRDCLNVEGVPNTPQGITFGQVLQPKMREVTGLLQVHGFTTTFGAADAQAQAQADQQQVGSDMFKDMSIK